MNFSPSKSPVIQWCSDETSLKRLRLNLLSEVEVKFGKPNRQDFAWVILNDPRESLSLISNNSQQTANQNQKDDDLLAGVAGFIHWDWIYISQLWVHPTLQGQGIGSQLLDHMEVWGRELKSLGIYIDTFDKKVAEFYKKKNFILAGEIPNFPKGTSRYFLHRNLSAGY